MTLFHILLTVPKNLWKGKHTFDLLNLGFFLSFSQEETILCEIWIIMTDDWTFSTRYFIKGAWSDFSKWKFLIK